MSADSYMSKNVATESLKKILSMVVTPAKGIKPLFEEYHVIKALLILYEKGPVGRRLLSRYLGLSMTSTRTLVKRLKVLRLVNVDPVGGCILTNYGYEVVGKILKVVTYSCDVTEILDRSLLLHKKAYAFLIKRGIELFKPYNITMIRDAIIRYGAIATVIIYVMNGRAFIPPCEEFNEDIYPSLRKLKDFLMAENHDVIVVIFADDMTIAEKSFFYALLELNLL